SPIATAADGAALIVQTGQDPHLAGLMAQLGRGSPGSPGAGSVPAAVSIAGDPADDAILAPAAAALFAAGALSRPQVLYAERPSRPIDIWREPVFISHPCQRPAGSDEHKGGESAQAGPSRSGPAANGASPVNTSTGGSGTGGSGTGGSGTSGSGTVGSSDIGAVTGVTPWFRCFAEQTERPRIPLPAGDDQPWCVYT